MVLEGEVFGKWLGEEDRALMDGISAFRKEASEGLLTPAM